MTRRAINRVSKFVMLGLALALAGPIGAKETELPKAADMLRWRGEAQVAGFRSEEHTSELQSLMRISYAVFCLKKKKNKLSTITIRYLYTTHIRDSSNIP